LHPAFATFARILEESPALRAKELEVMSFMAQALADALEEEGIDPRDARIASVAPDGCPPALLSRCAHAGACASTAPPAARRLRSDLERAYTLLEHGLGGLGVHTRTTAAAPEVIASQTI